MTEQGPEVSFREAWGGGETRMLGCRSLVIACGGPRDAIPLPSLDVPRIEAHPVLCALSCEDSPLSALDGRRAACVATLVRDECVPIARERGEVLFREGGISGIVVFDLSRQARPGDVVEIDLLSEFTTVEVEQRLGLRPGLTVGYRPDIRVALDGMLDPQIASVLWKLVDTPWADEHLPRRLGSIEGSGIVALAKGLPFRVTGVADPEHAQVTAGGIALEAIDSQTLGVIGHQGVYACGEALDVDGACGGYNLSFAWTSGMRAGASAARMAC